METFVSEILDSKVDLVKAKCDGLMVSQRELLSYINALEFRLESISVYTESLEINRNQINLLQNLRIRLIKVEKSLNSSLTTLQRVQKRIAGHQLI